MIEQDNNIIKAIVIRRIVLGGLCLALLISLTIVAFLACNYNKKPYEDLVLFLILGWLFGVLVFFGIIIPRKFHHFLYMCGMKIMKNSDYNWVEPENLAFKKSRILGIIAAIFSILMFVICIIIGVV